MAQFIQWCAATAIWTLVVFISPFAAAKGSSAIRLVSGPGYAPFVGPEFPGGGMLSEVVRSGFATAELSTTPITFEPWIRGLEATAAGRYDATFPYLITDERLERFIFSEPLIEVKFVAVFAAASGREYTGPDSLRGLRLCNPLGFALNSAVAPLVETGAIEEIVSPDVASCLRMLLRGRLDVFIGNELLVRYALRCAPAELEGLRFAGQPVEQDTLHLAIAADRPNARDLVGAFNTGLARLRATGEWQRLIDHHLENAFGCTPENPVNAGHSP